MAGTFENPNQQAEFSQLIGRLKAEVARTTAFTEEIQAEAAKVSQMGRESVARQEAEARSLGGQRTKIGGPTGVTREATRDVAAAERDLNAQLEREAALRQRAASEARGQREAARPAAQQAERPPTPIVAPTGASAEGRIRAADAARASQAEMQLGAATQGNILTLHQANNELQRHGALTTEFIRAAANGETTVRELGDQMLQTASKFGGWALAAAGVYGVINAVSELGRGAIDASDAAGNLERTIEGLNRGQAAQAVVGVAKETNVAMKDAGDATFLFSRTFHDVNDAAYVAGLALQSYKLDGVSVTDQVRAMTAVHQQFKVTATGMGPVWGLLANGQREFNSRVNEMVPAMIGSATAVANSGGKLEDYIKILQLALRTTQLSGAQLGTAFRRAPTFLARPTSQDTLRQLGFDPKQALDNFTDFFQEVLKRAPKMGGDARRQLFSAVFGPQQGQRLAGLSTVDPKLVKQIMGQSMDSSKPLVEEFSKLLNTPREQIARLGNNVQQVGAELGQAGVLGPLGAVVRLLNSGLSATQGMLKVWSDLPAPVREVGGYLAAYGAARALGSRFNLTNPIIGVSPEVRAQRQLTTGMQSEVNFYAEQRVAALRNTAIAGSTAASARLTAQRSLGTAGEDTAHEAYRAAVVRATDTANASASVEQQGIAAQERLTVVRNLLARGYTAEQAAQAAGVHFVLATQERGGLVTGGVRPVSNAGRAVAGEAAVGAAAESTAAVGVAAAESAAATQALTRASAVATEEMVTLTGAQRQYAETAMAENEALIGATAGAGRFRGALAGLGAGIGRLIPSILGISLIAGGITDAYRRADEAEKQTLEALNKAPGSGEEARALAKQIDDKAKQQFGSGDFGGLGGLGKGIAGIPFVGSLLLQGGTALANLGNSAVDAVSGGKSQDINAENSTPEGQAASLLRAMWAKRRTVTTTATGFSTGGEPYGFKANEVTGGGYELLLDQAKTDAATIPNTLAGRKRWQAELARFNRSAAQLDAGYRSSSQAKTKEGMLAAIAGLAAWRKEIDKLGAVFIHDIQSVEADNPFAQFKQMKDTDIVNSMQGIGDRVKLYGGTKDDLQRMATAYLYLADKYRGSRNENDLKNVVTAQSAFTDAVRSDVQSLIDEANAATTKAARKSGLEAARARLKLDTGVLTAAFAEMRRDVIVAGLTYQETQTVIATLEKMANQAGTDAISSLTKTPEFAGGKAKDSGIGQAGVIKGLKDAAAHALKRVGLTGSSIKQILAQLDPLTKSINSGLKSATPAASTDPFEIARLQSQLAQAQVQGDPVAVAAAQRQFAAKELKAAKNQKERLQAQIDLTNADYAYNQAVQDASQSFYDVLTAQTWDPIEAAAIAIRKAASALAHAHGTGGQNQARAQLIGAQHQQQQAIEDRVQAQYDLLESQTTDPVKQAAIELRKAQQKTRWTAAHGGMDSQAYKEALSNQNRSQQKLVEQQISEREGTIEFQLTMQQISNETAISQYQALLKVHGITKQLRRQVLERIQALKNEGQSEFAALDLGTIRLPTPYEIRRATLGAQNRMNVTQNYSTDIHVYDSRDANAVGSQMDRWHSGTGKSIQRATANK